MEKKNDESEEQLIKILEGMCNKLRKSAAYVTLQYKFEKIKVEVTFIRTR